MAETFEEFMGAVAREENERRDRGLGYDVQNGALRALHRRVVELEGPAPAKAAPARAATTPPRLPAAPGPAVADSA